MTAFLRALEAQDAVAKKIHLVGHSTGGILLAFLVQRFNEMDRKLDIETLSLLAPANTIEQYNEIYQPLLGDGHSVKIGRIDLYVLSEKRELDDNVAKVYRKSLLYLVSNAFEPAKKTPLLGMEKFHGLLDGAKKPRVLVASDGNEKTDSETHGGFDNDEKTMNSVLRAILGGPPKRPFTRLERSY